ncbi:MAG: gliding motility-associated C-terminal domain-containing protein [Bacteroidia bacterium]
MKRFLLLAFIQLLCLSAFATHIVGGDITLKNLGSNNFEVTLRFYRDCSPGTAAFDNPITLGAYDLVTNAEAFQFNLPLISQTVLTLGDTCFTPTGICVEEGVFRDTINLPNNPDGYYFSWQRCCRNNIIQNITLPGSAGMVFYCEFPNPAIVNSSPVFGSYPNAYFCAGQPNTQDFSAIDADGDSLAYFLVTPLNGNASSGTPIPTPSAGPYSNINWQSPYSATDMVGGTPVMSINPVTGILVAAPSAFGVYVFAVVVEEYRGGVKIGEVRRDIQYSVISCNTNQPPVFSLPTLASYTVVAGDSLCIPIQASDINSDWVGLSGTSELFTNPGTQAYTSFSPDSAIGSVQSSLCFYSKCEHIRDQAYNATFYARDYSCYGTNVVPYPVSIKVISPVDGQLDKIIPNVFTPNGDGQNELFKVNAKNIIDCFDKFDIKVYGRWGELLYESDSFFFKWDGKSKQGKAMSDGTYFYIIEGSFKDVPFTYKGSVQLIR